MGRWKVTFPMLASTKSYLYDFSRHALSFVCDQIASVHETLRLHSCQCSFTRGLMLNICFAGPAGVAISLRKNITRSSTNFFCKTWISSPSNMKIPHLNVFPGSVLFCSFGINYNCDDMHTCVIFGGLSEDVPLRQKWHIVVNDTRRPANRSL